MTEDFKQWVEEMADRARQFLAAYDAHWPEDEQVVLEAYEALLAVIDEQPTYEG